MGDGEMKCILVESYNTSYNLRYIKEVKFSETDPYYMILLKEDETECYISWKPEHEGARPLKDQYVDFMKSDREILTLKSA